MIKINIISLGKLKEKYLRDAVEEYSKRISGYAKLGIIELEPEKLTENPSESEIEAALKTEAEKIMKKLEGGSFTVAMCIEGKQMPSEELSHLMFEKVNGGTGVFNFIIGSSFGLHDSVKHAADLKFSFGAMTFPHQLFKVMLLEQIYRAFKINEGGRYHK
ncbi:MAG: 23S rRNA (pseudouridine(1915)-N(3))-methyltransferase RlmH [Clostridia bacterium]|nr:23S rRNA (pseudouridine(1915)-N(3))-methyltransferase RlmH [Clostridia bacterium]